MTSTQSEDGPTPGSPSVRGSMNAAKVFHAEEKTHTQDGAGLVSFQRWSHFVEDVLVHSDVRVWDSELLRSFICHGQQTPNAACHSVLRHLRVS